MKKVNEEKNTAVPSGQPVKDSSESAAPERIWVDPQDATFWNNNGDVPGLVEYVRAASQPPSYIGDAKEKTNEG